MRRRWLVIGVSMAIAVAIGFQQIEPLEELRKYGSLSRGVGNVGLDGYIFSPDGMLGDNFVAAINLISRCPSVKRLNVPKMPQLKNTLARVAKIEHVISLSLFKKGITDEDLAGLAGMKQLQFLELNHNPEVTDAGVAELAGLENVRHLDLSDTNVTGIGLKDRADMASLEWLTLNDCPVTDESLAAIPRFPKLEKLFLGRTNVTDKGLMSLVGWHSLRRVTRTALTTKAGSQAFNKAFLAARRKAREAGEPVSSRDIPPVFMKGSGWKDMPGKPLEGGLGDRQNDGTHTK
jgi:hypothetical protein